MEKEFSTLEVEAALCVWEWVLETTSGEYTKPDDGVSAWRECIGTVEARHASYDIGRYCLQVYDHGKIVAGDEAWGEVAYDWDVIPAICKTIFFGADGHYHTLDIATATSAALMDVNRTRKERFGDAEPQLGAMHPAKDISYTRELGVRIRPLEPGVSHVGKNALALIAVMISKKLSALKPSAEIIERLRNVGATSNDQIAARTAYDAVNELSRIDGQGEAVAADLSAVERANLHAADAATAWAECDALRKKVAEFEAAQSGAIRSLSAAYQVYLDAVTLYNERHAIMKSKPPGTMRVDEEYKAIHEAKRAFDKLAVDTAKATLSAQDNNIEDDAPMNVVKHLVEWWDNTDVRHILGGAPWCVFEAKRILSARTEQVQDVALPEGWQLVPKEATDFMIAAAIGCDWRRGNDTVRNIWRAMLAAAPAKQEG